MWKKRRRGERGVTMIELLVVLAIIGIVAGAIAIPAIARARVKRIRTDGMTAIPAIKGFEEQWFDRTGAFTYSGDTTGDKIAWQTVTQGGCSQPIQNSVFQQTVHAQVFTPPGNCTWEYWVIDDLCEADCALAGVNDARQTTGVLYCVIATARPQWSGGSQALPTAGERLCIDKIGHQYSNLSGLVGWP